MVDVYSLTVVVGDSDRYDGEERAREGQLYRASSCRNLAMYTILDDYEVVILPSYKGMEPGIETCWSIVLYVAEL